VVKTRQMMNDFGYSVETGPIVMYFLTRRMGDKDTAEIQRMIPRRDFVDKWKHLEHGAHDLAKTLTSKEAGTPSGSWKILTKASPENILFLSLTTRQQSVDQRLKNFFGRWRQTRDKLPFPEMEELRITPQVPEYQRILDEAFLLLLDGKLRSRTEIMNFLRPYEPPPPPPPPPVKRGRGKAAAVAPGGGPSAAAKRGRKPKAEVGAVATQPPGETAAAPVPEAKAAAGDKKDAVPAIQAPAGKAAVKKAPPAKPAKRQAKPAAKKPPAKKAATKKPPAKKAATKKAPAKKAVGKKAPAKKAPAKKAARKR